MNKFTLQGEGRPMRLSNVLDGVFFKTPQEHLCIRITQIGRSGILVLCYDFTLEKGVTHEDSLIVMPCDADVNLTSYTKGGNYYEYNNRNQKR